MRNISEILKKTRLENKITLDTVSNATKIKKEYLKYIESGEFDKIPSLSTTKGFIKIYAKYLGLNHEEAVMLFRRDHNKTESHMIKKKNKKIKINSIFYKNITLYIVLLILLIATIIIYGIHEYLIFKTPPKVEISSPQEHIFNTTKPYVNFSGKIQNGDFLYIDGVKINDVTLNGDFTQQVGLQEGLNNIDLNIKNQFGQETNITYDITYINLKKNTSNNKNAFSIEIKDYTSPVYINAVVENKTIYNKILKNTVDLKGIYNMVLTVGNLSDISIYYQNKNITPKGSGFQILIIDYNSKTKSISITKN